VALISCRSHRTPLLTEPKYSPPQGSEAVQQEEEDDDEEDELSCSVAELVVALEQQVRSRVECDWLTALPKVSPSARHRGRASPVHSSARASPRMSPSAANSAQHGLVVSLSATLNTLASRQAHSSPSALAQSGRQRGSYDWRCSPVAQPSGESSCGATLVIREGDQSTVAFAEEEEEPPWRQEGWVGAVLPRESLPLGESTDVLSEQHELMAHVSTKDASEFFTEEGGPGAGRLLGQGSYASVRLVNTKADCPPLAYGPGPRRGEELAAKIVRLGELESAEDSIRDIVLSELVFLSTVVPHPHLVSYRGSFLCREKGELWCMLEYCPGASLHDLLFVPGRRRRLLSDAEAAAVCHDILSGLWHMHDSGWAHRDVKPENVLRSRSGVFKLSDFGMSRPCSATERVCTGVLEGTLMYLAPEAFCTARRILLGQALCVTSQLSDVYSLGICTLVMKGVNATRKMSRPEVYVPPRWNKETFGPEGACLPRLLSSLLMDFVDRCLQDDPADRDSAWTLLSHPYIVSYAASQQMRRPESLRLDGANLFCPPSPRPHPQAHIMLTAALAACGPPP